PGMSRKPSPRSTLPEPSASPEGLAPEVRALRICVAEAAGNFWRKRAAAPAVVGVAKEVPETSDRPPLAPWAKVAKPLDDTPTLIRPSALGPRELKVAVWMPSKGRKSEPTPRPNWRSRRIRSWGAVLAAAATRAPKPVAGLLTVSAAGPSLPAATTTVIPTCSICRVSWSSRLWPAKRVGPPRLMLTTWMGSELKTQGLFSAPQPGFVGAEGTPLLKFRRRVMARSMPAMTVDSSVLLLFEG